MKLLPALVLSVGLIVGTINVQSGGVQTQAPVPATAEAFPQDHR